MDRASTLAVDDEEVTWRQKAFWLAAYVVAGAAAPRVVYFGGRLRGRPLVAVTAGSAMVKFAAMQWLRPWGERQNARRDAAREQLRAELGREPTIDEIFERLTDRPR